MRWLATTLVALLALSYALLTFSATDTSVHPAPDDTGLGGLSSLVAALRKEGYAVVSDRSARPRLGKNDVAVVPTLGDTEVPGPALEHARNGGRLWILSVPRNLQPVGFTFDVFDVLRHKAKIDETEYVSPSPPKPEGLLPPVSSWRTDGLGNTVASFARIGKGKLSRLGYGALGTNRFLGRGENAKVVLSTLESVSKKGDRLVFLAGGYGEAQSLGPIEAIGPWAVGALWQTFALMAAFGVARGVRFGLAEPEARQRRGARELLDAVALHYRLGKRTDAPIAAALRDRPDDAQAQALAARKKVPEAEARAALAEMETRPKPRRRF